MADEVDKPARPSLWRPLVGMAICVCLFVVALLIDVMTLCGAGAIGYGASGHVSAAAEAGLLLLFWSPVAGFVGCTVWLLVAAVRNALTDD